VRCPASAEWAWSLLYRLHRIWHSITVPRQTWKPEVASRWAISGTVPSAVFPADTGEVPQTVPGWTRRHTVLSAHAADTQTTHSTVLSLTPQADTSCFLATYTIQPTANTVNIASLANKRNKSSARTEIRDRVEVHRKCLKDSRCYGATVFDSKTVAPSNDCPSGIFVVIQPGRYFEIAWL